MTSKLTYMGAIGLTALSSVAATPAFAAGTTAGTTITNTATVDYQVGVIAQGQQSASNNFTVDRKINLLVEEVGTVTTTVVPGQTNAVTTFQLTNSSNETLDFALVASQIAGGTAAHGGTDTFDATNVRIYRDNTSTGTVGGWDVGDTLLTGYVDELVVDTAIRLFVVADIPAALANNAVAGVTLRATAREGGLAASPQATIVFLLSRRVPTPPAPYTAPSTSSPAALAGLRRPDDGQPFEITGASYGNPFTLSSPAPVRVDIPVDQPGLPLVLRRRLRRRSQCPAT